MRFLKEKKDIIISFIIGVIIASSITVYATSYFAKDVTYKDGKTVEYALNDLYERVNKGNLVYLETDQASNTYTFLKDYKTIYMAVFRGPDVPVIKINNVEQNYTIRREHSGYYIYIYKLENINEGDILYHVGYADMFTVNV